MNERGFFTIVGLCLLLAVAILIRGVQEFEGNYSTGTANSRIESDLQNLAESALFVASEKIPALEDMADDKPIPIDVDPNIIPERLKNLNAAVTVFGEKTIIYTEKDEQLEENIVETEEPGRVIISVASCDSPQIGGKIYRKAQAYIIGDTIHFLNDL